MQSFNVQPHEEGTTLLRWLNAHMPELGRGMVEKGIRKGWVKVQGRKPKATQALEAGDSITLADYLCDLGGNDQQSDGETPDMALFAGLSREEASKRFNAMIIFENHELIAINKPAGLAVQGGSKQKTSVDEMARAIATKDVMPRLVHRLDKDTSGVLVMAKTAKSATRLTKLFASKDIEKRYRALVINVPKPKRGQIDMPLIKALKMKGNDAGMEKVGVDDDDGKEAVTRYEVVHTAAQKYAWVNLYPITGRTHQLRVHMAAIKHPIVGDGKYGGERAFRAGDNLAKKLHLHAASITIPSAHGKAVTIEADIPAHMQQSWALLGGE